jgi:outer membrane receptor protein involved in Fe transport
MYPAHPLIACATVLFAALFWAGPSLAAQEDEPADPEAQILEEVVVEASRAGITALEIPVNTSILSRQDVEEFATRSTDEILRQVPGFSLLRAADSIAAAPSTATVSLRGLGGNAASRTLVLLDGIPIHSPISSEVYWARVPKHEIERIEIVRGGGANAWGNLSLGGVIDIITEPPRADGIGFSGILSYPWTNDLSLSGSQVTDRWELGGQASYFDTDGYFKNPPDQRGEVDDPVSKNYGIVSGKATYMLSERTRLFLSGSYFDEERHGGTPLDTDTTQIWTAGAGLQLDAGGGGTWRANVFYEDMQIEDYSTRIIGDREDEAVRGFLAQPATTTGAGLVWSMILAQNHRVTAGADYRWADVLIDNYERYLDGVPRELKSTDASQDMGGIFIQDTWQLSERWQLNGSIRYDHVSNRGAARVTDLETGNVVASQVYDSNSEHTTNPSAGLRYQWSDSLSLRAAGYKGFRAPTLRELYREGRTPAGVILANNPLLAPERLVGFEGGFDWNINDRTLLRATVFQNTVEDLIQNITRGQAVGEPVYVEPCGWLEPGETCRELENVGEMESTGLEIEAAYDSGDRWNFFLSYLYNDAIITRAPDDPQLVGKQVRQAPKHSFTARARYRGTWFDSTLLARYVGERYEDDLNTLEVDDFLLFDLRFSRRLSATTVLFLSIENLFDENYEVRTTNSGATEIGRPRSIGLGLNFRH